MRENHINTKVGVEPTTFQLEGWCPDHLAKLAFTHMHSVCLHIVAQELDW